MVRFLRGGTGSSRSTRFYTNVFGRQNVSFRRYLDTGMDIPNVPRDCLRVLTLKPGMRVEARYGGGVDYYPGIVKALNQRYEQNEPTFE